MNTKNMKPTTKEMLEAMGWIITCESPYEIEHIDGSTATGQSTQLVVDAIIEEYKAMKEEEALLDELNKKLESTKDLDLQKINGREIIDFLNNASNKDVFDDFNISGFKFTIQDINSDRYKLKFICKFNNWGTKQDIEGNVILISGEGIEVALQEPLDGNGAEETMEELLSNWIKTHEFIDSKTKFSQIINSIKMEIDFVTFEDKDRVDNIIKDLVEAQSYMK